VEKDGQSSKASKEWLGDLPLPDYELLYKALMELREESQKGLEAGKKKTLLADLHCPGRLDQP
jgi:hypothetical protein